MNIMTHAMMVRAGLETNRGTCFFRFQCVLAVRHLVNDQHIHPPTVSIR